MECLTLEDNGDIKRSDKYSIYLAAVEFKPAGCGPGRSCGTGAELPPGGTELKERLDIVNISLTCLRSRISTAIMELSGRNGSKETVVEDLKVLSRTAMHTCSNYTSRRDGRQ